MSFESLPLSSYMKAVLVCSFSIGGYVYTCAGPVVLTYFGQYALSVNYITGYYNKWHG